MEQEIYVFQQIKDIETAQKIMEINPKNLEMMAHYVTKRISLLLDCGSRSRTAAANAR